MPHNSLLQKWKTLLLLGITQKTIDGFLRKRTKFKNKRVLPRFVQLSNLDAVVIYSVKHTTHKRFIMFIFFKYNFFVSIFNNDQMYANVSVYGK